MKDIENLKPLEEIVIHNPETGQTMTTTAKKFRAIYLDKGWELIDDAEAAANAGPGVARQKMERNPAKTKTVENLGSAADIAAMIGLTGADESNVKTDDAVTGGNKTRGRKRGS
jgi:hypothetical protein